MNVFQSVGGLDEQVDLLLVGGQLAVFDHVVQADTVDQLENDELLSLKGLPILIGLNDVLVLHGGANRAFDGSLQAEKAGFELGGFDLIENFEAHHPAHVPRLVDLGHAALTGGHQLAKPFLDVDARQVAPGLAGKEFLEFGENTHGMDPLTTWSVVTRGVLLVL